MGINCRVGWATGVAWGLVLAGVSLGAHTASAAPGDVLTTVKNPWPAPPGWTQGFGDSIAGVASTIVVGAAYDDPSPDLGNAGSLMVFDAASGDFLRRVLNPNAMAYNNFGQTLATLGGNVVAGSENDNSDTGRAFVFAPATGNANLVINSPNPQYNASFGHAVATLGSNILAGEYERKVGGSSGVGGAYLLDGTTGALIREFLNPAPHAFDWFGNSVDGTGNKVVVGAYGFDAGGGPNDNIGRAYVLDSNTGALLASLDNPNPSIGAMFGRRVAFVGNNIAVTGGDHVYLFNGTTYQLIRTLSDPQARTGMHFGWAITGVGDEILVGEAMASTAYVFDGHSGNLLLTLNNPAPAYSFFGESVGSLNGNYLVAADDAAYLIQSIPEPSTVGLLAGTVGFLCLAVRRPHKRS